MINAMIRFLYEINSIGSHPDSLILGARFEEAKSVPARVMRHANRHDHQRVIARALFGQTLDQYAEGSIIIRQRDVPTTQEARVSRSHLHQTI